MASVASQLIEEVTAHAQTDSLEDAREICADGTYFPNNLRIYARLVNTYRMRFRPVCTCYVSFESHIYIYIYIEREREREL